MAPTIRVDEQVYGWLQGNARPFEDTPNSVLRRIAGLDATVPESSLAVGAAPRSGGVVASRPTKSLPVVQGARSGRGRHGLSGKQLNDEWGVGASHALFHESGSWFENLEHFPGALFDPHGYVLFKTEREYRSTPNVKVGKRTNVRGGISSLSGYVRRA